MENAVVAEYDVETWSAIDNCDTRGDVRSAHAMRMVSLTRMLAAAETAMLLGDRAAAAANLKQVEEDASLLAAELSAEPALTARGVDPEVRRHGR